MSKLRVVAAAALILSIPTLSAVAYASSLPGQPPILVAGDEPVVVTNHTIQTPQGPLAYEAIAGRLPIRNEETGEIRGHVFFVAYVVRNRGEHRPITFAWNGGPTVSSIFLHAEMLGPRRLTDQGFVDNAETLLRSTDLVLYDPVETGFSRPDKPAFASEFLNMQGDVAATAEFIRAYRARFRADDQPLFLLGESYGVWRAADASELLAKRGEKIAGVILISGDLPGVPMPSEFYDAMHIPARTATAYSFGRLSPDLMRDRSATMKTVNTWSTTVYLPALLHPDQLTDAGRETIAKDLARFTGMRPDQVDRKTLVVSISHFLTGFFDGDGTRVLNDEDARKLLTGKPEESPARVAYISSYLRDELGYPTDLIYAGLERGYMPTPGPPRRSTGSQWTYNQEGMTPEIVAKMRADGDPKYIAAVNGPWIENAMRMETALRVFVATGRYDPLNMCEGDVIMTSHLLPDLSQRITNHCYEGGHLMYRDEASRLSLSRDLAEFIKNTLAAQRDPP